jgi:metal-dependent amidase/aminoacylase/carboxypeptidase family protein
MKLIDTILADAPAITAIRRDLHKHPELCFHEERTADVIAKALTDWGIPVHRGLGKTGVVGIVKNGSSNRAVGLRADIDAWAACTPAATTATPRCCWRPPSTWPRTATSTARSISCSSPPKRGAAARAR